jgi:hypothetical protein
VAEENSKYDNEVFIDADSGFASEKNSYENLIIRQILECAKILSREMTGGQVIYKAGVNGTEKYVEDVRELVINHIETLKMLMSTYIKGGNKIQLNKILAEVEEHKKEIGEKEVIVPGKGKIKLGDFKGINVDNPVWKEFVHFKAIRYREIFEILCNCYNEEKSYIRSLEEE